MKLNPTLILFSLFFLLATPHFAIASSSFYLGAKGGPMISDLEGMDDAANGGPVLGYEFASPNLVGSFTIEGEYTDTLSDGDASISGAGGRWPLEPLPFMPYRSHGSLFVKGKIGVLSEYINMDVGGIQSEESDTGSSLGIGGASSSETAPGWKSNTPLSRRMSPI
jgi:hypothetical protein